MYDASGNKLKKVVHETGQADKTTLYLFGTYENDVLQFLPHEEGRIRPRASDNSFQYDYFLKDHLGNVRMVLTEESSPAYYPAATMEASTINTESSYYSNLSTTQWSKPGWFSDPVYPSNSVVARLENATGSQKIGPAILLKVMAGDSYNIRVASGWSDNSTSSNSSSQVLSDLVTALSSNLPGVSGGKVTQGQLQDPSSGLNSGISSFLSSQSNSGAPRAYVNWILFDEQFNVAKNSSGTIVASGYSGFDQVRTNGSAYVHPLNGLTVAKSGYLYIHTSNEATNIDVFFDNLQVTHIHGPIVEETQYYPFGLMMSGISSKALNFGTPTSKYKYNGKELQANEFSDGSGLEQYDYGSRNYDPGTARWQSMDAHGEKYEASSPYAYAFNNPSLFIDPNGKTILSTYLVPIIVFPKPNYGRFEIKQMKTLKL